MLKASGESLIVLIQPLFHQFNISVVVLHKAHMPARTEQLPLRIRDPVIHIFLRHAAGAVTEDSPECLRRPVKKGGEAYVVGWGAAFRPMTVREGESRPDPDAPLKQSAH